MCKQYFIQFSKLAVQHSVTFAASMNCCIKHTARQLSTRHARVRNCLIELSVATGITQHKLHIHTTTQHNQQTGTRQITQASTHTTATTSTFLPQHQYNYKFPIKIIKNLPEEHEVDTSIFVRNYSHPEYKCKITIRMNDLIKSNVLNTPHTALATTVLQHIVGQRYNMRNNTFSIVCRKHINNELNQAECFQQLDQVIEQTKTLTQQFVLQREQQRADVQSNQQSDTAT